MCSKVGFLRKNIRTYISPRSITTSGIKQNGYIVLLPEIGEDAPEKNPLFQGDGLPQFNNITIENCRAAIAKQTLDFEAGVKSIEESLTLKPYDNIFSDVIEPLEKVGMPLEMTWGLSKALYLGNSTLMPTSSYMAIHDRARRARSAKFNSLEIYQAVNSALLESKPANNEEVRVLKKFALEGKLNGLELNEDKKSNLREYIKTLTQNRQHFRYKIDMATKQFSHTINDRTVVREFPEQILKAIAVDPNYPMNGPWKITLQPHVYYPVMEYCPDREIRWNLWQALVTQGSNVRHRELTTSLNLEEVRGARQDIAKTLGYENFAVMSMETKMAGSIEEVHKMINELLERAKPAQERELESLLEFAKERGFKSDSIELWDIPYWKRKQINSVYSYNENEIKDYFPLPKVLEGLFQLCENLFNIVIRQRNVSAWHKDVKFFDVFEQHSSAPVAGFYFDPYIRIREKLGIDSKGWMVAIQNRSDIVDVKPLAALIFNFNPPTAEKQSYLTFNEVKILFQKFGHALQHLLTRTRYSEVAGLSNIEWDAVEVSGNMLPHWLYNKEVMESISSHCDSGDKLPNNLFQAITNSQTHMAGLELCKELYLSALDLELHSSKDFWLDIVKRLWPEYSCFPLNKLDNHPLSFTQIVTEEWGAAYYSHFWARMIAADVYSAFHEVQGNEQEIKDVGKRYRDTFLALGGSEHPSQIFREFRGRDPSPKALLKSLGIRKVISDC